MYARALEVVRTTNHASTSHLQRKMGIGYNHKVSLNAPSVLNATIMVFGSIYEPNT